MKYVNSYLFVKTRRETGALQSISVMDSFYYFIKNSRIELLNDQSAYGMIFKCDFQGSNKKSPYFYLDSCGETANVTTIVIKLALLSDSETQIECLFRDRVGEMVVKYCDMAEKFKREVTAMMCASELGAQRVHRNTPVLLYSNLYEENSWNYRRILYYLLRNAATECDREIIRKINRWFLWLIKTYPDCSIFLGLIAMEYIIPEYRVYCKIIKPIINDKIRSIPGNEDINKYDSLTLSSHSRRLRWLYNIARYDLLRLAIDTGYSQGDYHTENLLLDEPRKFTMIIDFGKATEIPGIEYCRKSWSELVEADFADPVENLLKIGAILMSIFNATTCCRDSSFNEYTWLKDIDEEDVEILAFIHKSRVIKNRVLSSVYLCDDIFRHYFKYRAEYLFQDGWAEPERRPTICERLGYYWWKRVMEYKHFPFADSLE
jgi:hypothetical protein